MWFESTQHVHDIQNHTVHDMLGLFLVVQKQMLLYMYRTDSTVESHQPGVYRTTACSAMQKKAPGYPHGYNSSRSIQDGVHDMLPDGKCSRGCISSVNLREALVHEITGMLYTVTTNISNFTSEQGYVTFQKKSPRIPVDPRE